MSNDSPPFTRIYKGEQAAIDQIEKEYKLAKNRLQKLFDKQVVKDDTLMQIKSMIIDKWRPQPEVYELLKNRIRVKIYFED